MVVWIGKRFLAKLFGHLVIILPIGESIFLSHFNAGI